MIIFGIINNDLVGVCLVCDGGIVVVVSEECFICQKDYKVWLSCFIDYVFGEVGIDLVDIDCIVYGWNVGFDVGWYFDFYLDWVFEEVCECFEGLLYLCKWIVDEMVNDKVKCGEFDVFVCVNGLCGKVEYIDYYECYVFGVFVCLLFDEVLIFICDGCGDFQLFIVIYYCVDGGEMVL